MEIVPNVNLNSNKEAGQTQHFEVNDAMLYGTDAAIILYNIKFWLRHELANYPKCKHHDGYVWTFNSAAAYAKLFPYFSPNKIQKILKKLESDGVLIVGNYNQKAYDKTKWYTMTGFEIPAKESEKPSAKRLKGQESLQPNGLMDSAKRLNGFSQTAEPIPDINTDVIKDKNNSGQAAESMKRLDPRIDQKAICIEAVNYLNDKAGKAFTACKTNRWLVNDLLKEGYTLEQIKGVIDLKCRDWLHDAKYRKNLRPATLFKQSLFSQYVGELSSDNKPVSNNVASIEAARQAHASSREEAEREAGRAWGVVYRGIQKGSLDTNNHLILSVLRNIGGFDAIKMLTTAELSSKMHKFMSLYENQYFEESNTNAKKG